MNGSLQTSSIIRDRDRERERIDQYNNQQPLSRNLVFLPEATNLIMEEEQQQQQQQQRRQSIENQQSMINDSMRVLMESMKQSAMSRKLIKQFPIPFSNKELNICGLSSASLLLSSSAAAAATVKATSTATATATPPPAPKATSTSTSTKYTSTKQAVVVKAKRYTIINPHKKCTNTKIQSWPVVKRTTTTNTKQFPIPFSDKEPIIWGLSSASSSSSSTPTATSTSTPTAKKYTSNKQTVVVKAKRHTKKCSNTKIQSWPAVKRTTTTTNATTTNTRTSTIMDDPIPNIPFEIAIIATRPDANNKLSFSLSLCDDDDESESESESIIFAHANNNNKKSHAYHHNHYTPTHTYDSDNANANDDYSISSRNLFDDDISFTSSIVFDVMASLSSCNSSTIYNTEDYESSNWQWRCSAE